MADNNTGGGWAVVGQKTTHNQQTPKQHRQPYRQTSNQYKGKPDENFGLKVECREFVRQKIKEICNKEKSVDSCINELLAMIRKNGVGGVSSCVFEIANMQKYLEEAHINSAIEKTKQKKSDKTQKKPDVFNYEIEGGAKILEEYFDEKVTEEKTIDRLMEITKHYISTSAEKIAKKCLILPENKNINIQMIIDDLLSKKITSQQTIAQLSNIAFDRTTWGYLFEAIVGYLYWEFLEHQVIFRIFEALERSTVSNGKWSASNYVWWPLFLTKDKSGNLKYQPIPKFSRNVNDMQRTIQLLGQYGVSFLRKNDEGETPAMSINKSITAGVFPSAWKKEAYAALIDMPNESVERMIHDIFSKMTMTTRDSHIVRLCFVLLRHSEKASKYLADVFLKESNNVSVNQSLGDLAKTISLYEDWIIEGPKDNDDSDTYVCYEECIGNDWVNWNGQFVLDQLRTNIAIYLSKFIMTVKYDVLSFGLPENSNTDNVPTVMLWTAKTANNKNCVDEFFTKLIEIPSASRMIVLAINTFPEIVDDQMRSKISTKIDDLIKNKNTSRSCKGILMAARMCLNMNELENEAKMCCDDVEAEFKEFTDEIINDIAGSLNDNFKLYGVKYLQVFCNRWNEKKMDESVLNKVLKYGDLNKRLTSQPEVKPKMHERSIVLTTEKDIIRYFTSIINQDSFDANEKANISSRLKEIVLKNDPKNNPKNTFQKEMKGTNYIRMFCKLWKENKKNTNELESILRKANLPISLSQPAPAKTGRITSATNTKEKRAISFSLLCVDDDDNDDDNE